MNRASRIAAPIVAKAFHGNRPDEVNAQSVARAVRKALLEFRYPDGGEIHPCVIEEWANESHRRVGMHKRWRERHAGLKRYPSKQELDAAEKKLQRQRLVQGDKAVFSRATAQGSLLSFIIAARRIFRSAGRNQ